MTFSSAYPTRPSRESTRRASSSSSRTTADFEPGGRVWAPDINRIGDQIIHNKEWENPLRVFKGAAMRYGSSIQESAFKWIKAHTYNINDSALTKINEPEAAVWYHTVNREDRYDITLEYPDLRQAFLDEYGLNRLIDAVLVVPRNSDNYDEYLCMMAQMSYYEQNWGFFKQHASGA